MIEFTIAELPSGKRLGMLAGMTPHVSRFVQMAVLCAITTATAPATTVGTGLIHQLVYQGKDSLADRIPLAPAIVNANYNYGSHSVIFAPRPCFHGHFGDREAVSYEQNLAVLYGVDGEFSDPTQLPGSTLAIRLRKTTPPADAPFTLEQITAAAIQCVIEQAGELTEERPLTVTIFGDGIETPAWTSKYTRPYFSLEKTDDTPARPALVPGINVIEVSHGVRYVFFDGVLTNTETSDPHPVFLPFMTEGESADGGNMHLIPTWHGDVWNDRLNVLTRPVLPYYERWRGGIGGRNAESVALPHQTGPGFPMHSGPPLSVDRRGEGTLVELRVPLASPEQLAAFIFACLLTERPTDEAPLTIAISDRHLPDTYRERLREDTAWQDGRCEFAFDPATLKLTKGSVPGFSLSSGYRRAAMITPAEPNR